MRARWTATARRAAFRLALAGLALAEFGIAPTAGAQPFRRIATGPQITPDAGTATDRTGGLVVFAGGFARPRPHLVDLAGDARLDLVVQDEPGRLRLFERIGAAVTGADLSGAWQWRSDRLLDAAGAPLVVGEWVRFVDGDGDGDLDLFAEAVPNLVRYYRRDADGFRRDADALLRTDGVPVAVDRQNLPAAGDLTGDGRVDLVTAQTDGTLTFFEGAAPGPDGLPRFLPPVDGYQGIQIIGEFSGSALGETGGGDLRRSVLDARHAEAPKHGASALTLADVDGDGDLDLVWGDFFSPSLYLVRNDGTPTAPRLVRASDAWPGGSAPRTTGYNASAVGDVTGDGRADLLVGVVGGAFGTDEGGSPLTVRTGQDVGAFGPPVPLVAAFDAGTASHVAALPGGGARAVLLVSTQEGMLLRLTPGADGAYTSRAVATTDWPPSAAVAAFPTGSDLAVGGFDGRVTRFVPDGAPDGTGGYRAAGLLAALPRAQLAVPALGDVDGDGRADLVVGSADGRVALFRGATGGAFALVTETLVPTDDTARRTAPALGDATGDGVLDLAIGDEAGRIRLFSGDGRGGFALLLPLDALPGAAPAFVDLDGDGDLDLLAGTEGGGLVRFANERLASVDGGPVARPPRVTVRATPTPARTHVRLDTGGQPVSVVVVDALGRTVARAAGADPVVAVDAWPVGLYAAHLYDFEGRPAGRAVLVVAR